MEMKEKRGFTSFVSGRLKAFKYVFRGMFLMLKGEASLQVQFLLFMLTAVLSYYLGFSTVEWAVFFAAWGLIFTAETLNTSVERLSDVVSPDYDERIRDVKDLAAGAVGWAAAMALIAYIFLILKHI
jgi:diacylglycerol kinase (ATP)